MDWNTDRRGLLKAAGALAGLMTVPNLAWAVEGDTLRVRVDGDLQVLDPWGNLGGIDEMIPRCTTVALIRFGDTREGNQLFNWGAEKYEWTDDKTIAFTLREGLVWNKGFGPVTSDDVKYSFERIASSDSPWAYQFEKLDHVEVVDARSGIIHLKEAFRPFEIIALPYYGGHIVCKAAVEAVGGKYTTEIPAECGPFLMESWEQGQKATLVANPDWTGPKPDFNKIEIYIVVDDQAAQLAYEADAFDYTRLAVSASKQVKENLPAGATLLEMPSSRYTWLTINIASPQLQDIRVRQAIQYAYDGEAVLLGAYDGLTGRSAGVVLPSTPYAREKNLIERDVEKAKALLAEAGVSDLTLTLNVQTDGTSQAVAQIIQASMAEAGITIEIAPTEDAAYWVLGDKTQGDGYKTIELVLMSFAGGIEPTENLVWFRPDQIGAWNWSSFDSPEYEELYQKAQIETDVAKRKELCNRMEDLMEQSGGFIFICFEPFVALHDDNLKPVILSDGYLDPVMFKKL